MPELARDFTVLSFTLALTSLLWLLCALASYFGYRAYRQRMDLGWVAAFLLLSLGRAIEAYVAKSWADSVGSLTSQVDPLTYASFTQLRVAGLELVAALLILLLFRQRRATF